MTDSADSAESAESEQRRRRRRMRWLVVGVVFLVGTTLGAAFYHLERNALRTATANTIAVRGDLIEQYIELMRHKVYALEEALEARYPRVRARGAQPSRVDEIRHFPEYAVWGISGLAEERGVPDLSGSLTGGRTLAGPGPRVRAELDTLLGIDGQFETLLEHVPEIIWVYYTSVNEFIYIAPDPAVADFRFSSVLYDKPFWTAAIPENNPEQRQVITELYDDAYGQGLMISISSPVHFEDRFTGVVSLDIGIDRLRALTDVGRAAGESILVDEDDRIVARGGDFELGETYRHQADEGWYEGPDGAEWRSRSIAPNELTLLHRLPEDELAAAAVRNSALPWTVLGAVMVLLVISARLAEALGQVRTLMHRDTLTDLLNRRGLEARARTPGAGAPAHAALLLFDIDRFKAVNDSRGHEVGDRILADLGRILVSGVGEDDLVCRWGGEEILVLLRADDPATFPGIGERLRRRVQQRSLGHDAVAVTVSGGLTQWHPGEPLGQAVDRADRLLYRAKANGRNRVEHDLGNESDGA